MFKRVLIANRGEIACRIIETCRRLGIESLVVYSDADRQARHVRLAEQSVYLGQPPADRSYLDQERLLAVAVAHDVEAVHPGYGFLAENAEFAQRCHDAGLVFIGPRPETIRAMGSKQAAKSLMESAGVPVVPGHHGEDQDDITLAAAANDIGYPVLIKPSAGGGGKGMQVVHDSSGFAPALEAARRIALSAFGDDRMIIEKFLSRPRHIEFQVFGDVHGQVIHLFERECSIQRRYQKIIEETPSPLLNKKLRKQMGDAAVAAAKAVDYINAGTVEFIVNAELEFFFIEMNTRLQVEHPVSEMVTGLDLVEWQLNVACGKPLPLAQKNLSPQGHAIEARIYAENPDKDFLPSTGRVHRFLHPPTGRDLRIDSGIDDGDAISIHYDPMIAKLIVHAADRAAAIKALRTALNGTSIFGLDSNIRLLRQIAADAAFAAGEFDTTYVDTQLRSLVAAAGPAPEAAFTLAAARFALDLVAPATSDTKDDSPWNLRDNWRLGGGQALAIKIRARNGDVREFLVVPLHDELEVRAEGQNYRAKTGDNLDQVKITGDGVIITGSVWRYDDACLVAVENSAFRLTRVSRFDTDAMVGDDAAHPGSPMPGRIVAVRVREGDKVDQGQILLVLEGMKMEYALKAGVSGQVGKIYYDVGDMVEAEVPLVDIESLHN